MRTDQRIEKDTFPVIGMSCAACATRVDKVLNKQPGVCQASVNYASATAKVEYDASVTSPYTLRKAVQDAGYDLFIQTGQTVDALEKQRDQAYQDLKRRTIYAFTLSIVIMLISMCFHEWEYARMVMWLLSTPVVFFFGRGFFTNAYKQLKHHTANMDTLVACSTGIAYTFSLFNLCFPSVWTSRGLDAHVYFESAAMIISFILLGRLLEAKAKGNTATAIKKLMGLQPETVTIIKDKNERTVPIQSVLPDDTVLIKPGDRIPVDGTVTEGHSYVDESMLSGEPVAISKATGDKVYAGTLNQKGSFKFRAEKIGTETMLAKIIQMVQDAQGSKAPVQQVVDKVAAVFVPVIMGIALLACICWMIWDHTSGISHGILALVTVLIIACPCALGLATPTAIMVGVGKGAEQGILIKDAESLEIARHINTVVMDKTGTITEGKTNVSAERWTIAERSFLKSVLVSMERLSEHPLATAITNHITAETVPVATFESLTGKGVKGQVNDQIFYVGNRTLMDECHIPIPTEIEKEASKLMEQAETVIWFADSSSLLAVFGISDQVKETSRQAIADLQLQGIEVVMMTGDNEATAKEIAKKIGITSYQAGVLPEQKATFISQLQQKGKRVAMVGDGINDSAALAQADLSIAMGNGSDIAIDTANVTIISSDLTKISAALELSRQTVKTIRQNLFWAFFYNMIAVPIAAGILYPVNGFLLNPMIGGIAMAFSSVSVVCNSLLLKRKKIGDKTTKETINNIVMKKEYKVEGMMCMHCRMHVENALNSMEGVKATVTLTPPVATIEFEGEEKPLEELQRTISEKAGDYKLLMS